MTVTDWIRENYADFGRDCVINGIEECRAVTSHNSSASTWDRLVRRVIREMEGSGPEPEESFQVRTLEDAMSYHDIPEHLMDVKKVHINTWGSPTNANQQVKVELAPKSYSLDPKVWADSFRSAVASVKPVKDKPHQTKGKTITHLLSIPDVHFGKLIEKTTIGGEGASSYDPHMAATVMTSAVQALAVGIDTKTSREIIFPVGEDLLNVDNLSFSTTAGTPQQNSDVYTMVSTALETLFSCIDYLSTLAPVSVPIVSGNHDRLLSYMVGLVLNERYRESKRVTINVSPVREKVYQYGSFTILLIHADKMKTKDIAWRMATKYPSEWAASKHRYAFSGHWHNYSAVDEQGVIVSFLPSLSPRGVWEDSLNFFSVRQAQIHSFEPEKGRVYTAYYTV